MRYSMKNLNVKSRLAMFGTASFLLLAVTGTAQAELVDETRTSMSRSTIQVDHSSVSMALAAKQSYRSQSSYKWANHEPSPPPADSTWADNKESDSGYKWAVTQLLQNHSKTSHRLFVATGNILLTLSKLVIAGASATSLTRPDIAGAFATSLTRPGIAGGSATSLTRPGIAGGSGSKDIARYKPYKRGPFDRVYSLPQSLIFP